MRVCQKRNAGRETGEHRAWQVVEGLDASDVQAGTSALAQVALTQLWPGRRGLRPRRTGVSQWLQREVITALVDTTLSTHYTNWLLDGTPPPSPKLDPS